MPRAGVRRGALVVVAALLLGGCGAMPAQDEDEPEGEFPVTVERVSFPENQTLAKDSRLLIEVRNVGDRTLPNVNVTLTGLERKLRDPNDPAVIDPGVAAPARPIFVVDKAPVEFLRDRSEANASLVDREVNPPYGKKTAYVDTYSLGELPPGESARFRWNLSAVHAGDFEIRYVVNAGLDGKAVAVSQGGEPLTGTFTGAIDRTPPPARVASDGETIVNAPARPSGQGGRGVVVGD